VLRASAIAERAGIPTSSLVCEGFLGQGKATAVGLGLPNIPMAMIPGHVDLQGEKEIEKNVQKVTVEQVIQNLTGKMEEALRGATEPGAVMSSQGTFEEVNELFYRNEWSDGLPIVPPTIEKVQAFLRFTDRSPDEGDRHFASRQPEGHHMECSRERGDGGLSARVYACFGGGR